MVYEEEKKMTVAQIKKGFERTIDQWYAFPNKEYVRENQLQYIGGILQAALHILPNDSYFALKQYVYDKHGYDPGGCDTGQYSLSDYIFGEVEHVD